MILFPFAELGEPDHPVLSIVESKGSIFAYFEAQSVRPVEPICLPAELLYKGAGSALFHGPPRLKSLKISGGNQLKPYMISFNIKPQQCSVIEAE